MFWFDLLQTLGFFSVAVAALTWLSQSLASQILSRDMEKYKSELQRDALEHQVRFTRIHEKQAEVIEKYYDYLRSARDCINALRASKNSDVTDHDKKLLEKTIEFCFMAAIYHRSNELYFNSSISDRAKKLELEILKYGLFSSGTLGLMGEASFDEVPEDKKSMIEAALKGGLHKIDDQITPLLELLKKDFQKFLGIDGNS